MDEKIKYSQIIKLGGSNQKLAKQRIALAELAAETFLDIGRKLHVIGHMIGEDRKCGNSPFGHGTDEVVGIAILLQMGGHLVSASASLLTQGNPYAGAALLRQIVEIEYLAWAFDTRNKDAELWLRSNKTTRMKTFTPVKLRNAAGEKFRGKDYAYHCELGGHPTPTGSQLLQDQPHMNQLLLSDLLGHVAGVWNHFIGWAKDHEETMSIFSAYQPSLSVEINKWLSTDPLVDLPPPP